MFPSYFGADVLHPDRLAEDEGALDKLFVRMVFDLYVGDYPTLSNDPGGGKDGAIDLWNDTDCKRTAFECKKIGHGIKQMPWKEARTRWHTVRDRLVENLPKGAEKCHGPYRAWFSRDPHIAKYLFVVSCPIFPVSHKDDLRREIKATFAELSQASSDLGHLQDILVEVVDWNDLRGRLEAQPTYLFKWFQDFLVPGLRQITLDRPIRGFRKYQHEQILPYYSIHAHLSLSPVDGIEDERQLWRTVIDNTSGLVISGAGGVGKSRLMMELGKLAQQDGWLVFEAEQNIKASVVERVARRHANSGVLFLFDYLENLPEFRNISLSLARFAGDGMRVRFIASARNSFANDLFDDSVRVFRHAPDEGRHSDWWRTYRIAAIEHIGGHLGIPQGKLFTDIPAVAVLESELSSESTASGDDNSAKNWVGRRLSLLRRDGASRKSLALVAAQLPFREEYGERLPNEARVAFSILRNSGWIEIREEMAGRRSCWMLHDYLADQIVLDWLSRDPPQGMPKTPELRQLLGLAYLLGSLGSLIASLQRILGEVSGFGLDTFSSLIQAEIAANGDIWKAHRQDVLYTRLLSPQEKVLLLHRLGKYWQGAERETWFQLEIAALAKSIASHQEWRQEISVEAWRSLEAYVVSLASDADERNMLVTYGLRLLPANRELQLIAQQWLANYGDCFGATYVLRAWMDIGLPWRQVEAAVRIWLQRFAHSVDAQFVLAAWLRAAGNAGVRTFESEVVSWCFRYARAVEAQNVFSAWLDAGGIPATVQDGVAAWFSGNVYLEQDASHLLRSWLRADGDPKFVMGPLIEWLKAHQSTESASFVYTAASDKPELQGIAQAPMLDWIKARAVSPASAWCIAAWLRSGFPRGEVASIVREWLSVNIDSSEAGNVMAAWFHAKGKIEMVLPHLAVWLNRFGDTENARLMLRKLVERQAISDEAKSIACCWLQTHDDSRRAENVLSAWLNGGYGTAPIRESVVNWCAVFRTEPEARFLYEKWATAGGDADAIRDAAISWLQAHDQEVDAGRVLTALLKAGVRPQEYLTHLKAWTRCHDQCREASYFYCEWLSHDDLLPSGIRKSVWRWLEEHAEWRDADFVLNAWLKHKKSETEIVRPGFERWIARYHLTREGRTVVENWEAALARERMQRRQAQQ